jgi:hypothetical protein
LSPSKTSVSKISANSSLNCICMCVGTCSCDGT